MSKFTQAQVDELLNKSKGKPQLHGKARLGHKVGMNKLEQAYAAHLTKQVEEGKILRWDFEPERLKLACATYYSPDFRVIQLDGTIEFHETKGFWTDDARVKIKVAAALHPYKFVSIYKIPTKVGGGWRTEEVKVEF